MTKAIIRYDALGRLTDIEVGKNRDSAIRSCPYFSKYFAFKSGNC